MTSKEVQEKAKNRLTICPDLTALHVQFATDLFDEIKAAKMGGEMLNLILPVGPTGQYPFLVDRLKAENLGLRHCRLFFMDEYADDYGNAFPREHPLSFKGIADRLLFKKLPAILQPPERQILFPNEENINQLDTIIEEAGGIHACFGGVGIHGHIAFNEPENGVSKLGSRKVRLNAFTITINTIRASVGGNLEAFPQEAYTLGLKTILSAKKIYLYIRNGTSFDWANTVLRLALFGTPGDDYPVTHIRNKNYHITTDENTLKQPQIVL